MFEAELDSLAALSGEVSVNVESIQRDFRTWMDSASPEEEATILDISADSPKKVTMWLYTQETEEGGAITVEIKFAREDAEDMYYFV